MWRAWKNMSIFIIFPLFIPLSEWFWSWSAQWEAGLAVCRPWPRTWNSQPSTPHGSQIFRCTVACFLCSTFDQRTERERCTRVIKIPWAFAGDMWKLLSKSCQCTFPNAKNVLLISVSWFEKKLRNSHRGCSRSIVLGLGLLQLDTWVIWLVGLKRENWPFLVSKGWEKFYDNS